MKPPFDLTLYLVTDCELSAGRDLVRIVCDAVAGGVTMVQIRDKSSCTRDFVALARKIKSAVRSINPSVAVVANDRVDVALAAALDGVHIGQSDMSYGDARALLGPDKIIGLSVENMDDVAAAAGLDVDYIGISPIYATPTKEDTSTPFGLAGCTAAMGVTGHRAVAIGGMNCTTIPDVMACGVEGVAVVSAIIGAEDPETASSALRDLLVASKE